MISRSIAPALLLSLVIGTAPAQEPVASWTQFRGPGQRAVADGAEVPLPLDLEAHRLWKVELPEGHSSPVIFGERLYLTGAEDGQLVMVCLDRRTGETLWRHSVEARAQERYGHRASAHAMPSACTDGRRVFFYFGAFGLLALDAHDGKTLWQHELPLAAHEFGTGSSPVLVDDLVVVLRDGAPDSAIVAYAQESGEERWRTPRLGFFSSYATPYLWRHAQGRELVVAGTGSLQGLDPKDGRVLWEVRGLTLLTCPSPIGDDERLYYSAWSTPGAAGTELLASAFGEDFTVSAEDLADPTRIFRRLDADGNGVLRSEELPKGCRAQDAFDFFDTNRDGVWQPEEILPALGRSQTRGKNCTVAVRSGGRGDVTETHVAWTRTRGVPYVSSPLLYRDRLWLVKAGGLVTCLEAANGEPVFEQARLTDRGEYYATPLGLDGHVLIAASSGRAALVDADASELRVVAELDFGDELLATPAALDGVLYVRTRHAMWALGKS